MPPPETFKTFKTQFEGFEGDRTRHFLENDRLNEGDDLAAKNLKNTTPAYPQNLQNLSSPSGPATPPDGIGARVEIIALPQAQRYRKAFGVLQLRPPALVPVERWQQCVEDGSSSLAKWGEQAEALGWTSADLFGLHSPALGPLGDSLEDFIA